MMISLESQEEAHPRSLSFVAFKLAQDIMLEIGTFALRHKQMQRKSKIRS